jgi:hypothetical protein
MKQYALFVYAFICIPFILNAQQNNSFTIKHSNELPTWFDNASIRYMLNDDRLVEYEEVQFIGGLNSDKGEIFFIGGQEIVFPESQVKITEVKNQITKILTSGDYMITLKWNSAEDEGTYSSGTLTLSYKNVIQLQSSFILTNG